MKAISHSLDLKPMALALAVTCPWFAQSAQAAEEYEIQHLDREVTFQCSFPLLGERFMPARIRTTGPQTAESGSEYEISVSAELTLEEFFRETFRGLIDADTMTLEARMTLEQQPLLLTSSGQTAADLPAIVANLTLPRTDIPQSPGAFTVTAESPSIAVVSETTSDSYGVEFLNGEDLPLTLNFFREDGSQVDDLADAQVNCTQTSVPPGPLAWQPEEVDFGWVIPGMSQSRTLVLHNSGPRRLISDVYLEFPADASAAFLQTNDCTVLDAGESCQAEVTFAPSSSGTRQAYLIAKSSTGDARAILTGISDVSGRPQLVATPDAVNFGVVEAGQQIKQEVTIRNQSVFAADLSGITLDGDDASLFQLSENCGNRIAPWNQCIASVVFMPYDSVAATASLNIQVQGIAEPLTVPISSDKPTDLCDIDVHAERVPHTGEILFSRADAPTAITGDLVRPRPCPDSPARGELKIEPFNTRLPPVKTLFGRVPANAQASLSLTQPLAVQETGPGYLIAQGQYRLQVPEVAIEVFGIRIPMGGGASCQTKEPVTATFHFPQSPGEEINATLEIGAFENCGLGTTILNRRLQGDSHSVTIRPDEPVDLPEVIISN